MYVYIDVLILYICDVCVSHYNDVYVSQIIRVFYDLSDYTARLVLVYKRKRSVDYYYISFVLCWMLGDSRQL